MLIQPLIATEDKPRIAELLSKAPPDLKDLLSGTDFIDLVYGDKDYWNVGMEKVKRVLSDDASRRSKLHPRAI